MKKTTRARRIAFGRLCTTSAIMLQSLANLSLSAVEFEDRSTDESIMSDGEKAYLQAVKLKVHKDATTILKFGQRLQKK